MTTEKNKFKGEESEGTNIIHVEDHHQCGHLPKRGKVPNRKTIMKMSHPNRNISSIVLSVDSPPVHSI